MSTFDELKDTHNSITEMIERTEDSELTDIVFEQLGCGDLEEFDGTLQDVTTGGANAGFNGFIYSKELLEFWQENKTEIIEALDQQADDLGEEILTMIEGFTCLNGDYSKSEIGKVLYGDSTETQIVDALGWWTLEQVAFLAER